MSKKMTTWLGLLALALAWASGARAVQNTVDGTLTVTPVASVSLELAPTYYAFGQVGLTESTHSLTMQGLHNMGTVGVVMQKKIAEEPSGWTAGTDAAPNVYVLYAATTTAAVPPDTSVFTSQSATKFATGLGNNVLDEGDGDTGPLPLGGSTTIWYRLDMPTASADQTPRTIKVTYTGTAL